MQTASKIFYTSVSKIFHQFQVKGLYVQKVHKMKINFLKVLTNHVDFFKKIIEI